MIILMIKQPSFNREDPLSYYADRNEDWVGIGLEMIILKAPMYISRNSNNILKFYKSHTKLHKI